MFDKDILDDEFFIEEKFDKFSAFVDLCKFAVYKPFTFRIRGIRVDLQPMQLAKSAEYLAERWHWNRKTVIKFLNELEESGIIEIQKSRVVNVITIKKYFSNRPQNAQKCGQQKTESDSFFDGQQKNSVKIGVSSDFEAIDGQQNGQQNGQQSGQQNGQPYNKEYIDNTTIEDSNNIYAEAELRRERDSLLKQVEAQNLAMDAMQRQIDELTQKVPKEEEAEMKPSSKTEYPSDFEEDYKLYQRKGSKKRAYDRWKKLSDEDKAKMRKHIPLYWQSNTRQYLKDFEGYINQRTFETPITGRDGSIIYDPDMYAGQTYTPQGYGIVYSESRKVFMYLSMYDDGDTIYDGYTNENRPDNAKIELNNARGTITWSKQQQRWNRL